MTHDFLAETAPNFLEMGPCLAITHMAYSIRYAIEFNEKSRLRKGSFIKHVVKIFGIFDPPPLPPAFVVTKAYVIKWSFG